MYRAITLKAMNMGLDLKDEEALVRLARNSKIEMKFRPNFKILLDGEDVSDRIRTPEVTANVHYLARLLGVRRVLWKFQREIGENGGVVAEGRDMGTVVFPRADIKFYLDASSNARVRRRHKDFKLLNRKISHKKLTKEIIARDKKDKTREIAPLKKAKGAVVIDTTSLLISEVLEKMLKYI
jgi:cytidylate kinase